MIEKIENQIKQLMPFVQEWGWALKLFIAVLITILLAFLWRKINPFIAKKLEKTKTDWDDILLKAINPPVEFAIWSTGAWVVLKFITQFSAIKLSILYVGIIFAVSWAIIRFLSLLENKLLLRAKLEKQELLKASTNSELLQKRSFKSDPSTILAIGKILRLAVFITSSLIAMQTVGVNISAVLAFGGVGGIAIGFAAKDLLSNFLGGLIIYLDRPFSVGDWVRSPDREIEGTVEKIGWRQTQIRTFTKRALYVPNSVFNNIALENPSRMTNRRIKETIGIRYDDFAKVNKIIDEIRIYLANNPEIDTTKTLMVNFNHFGASSLDFFIYTFTKTTNWVKYHGVKHEILITIGEIIEKNDAQIAFPTQTLQISGSVESVSEKNK